MLNTILTCIYCFLICANYFLELNFLHFTFESFFNHTLPGNTTISQWITSTPPEYLYINSCPEINARYYVRFINSHWFEPVCLPIIQPEVMSLLVQTNFNYKEIIQNWRVPITVLASTKFSWIAECYTSVHTCSLPKYNLPIVIPVLFML